MNNAILPQCFDEIDSQVSNVRRKNANEYSSSCPWCGGNDRFVLLISSHKGTPFAFCRQDASHIWSPNRSKLSKQDWDEIRRRQIEVEEERRVKAEKALEVLRNERAWERFYKQHNQWSMDLLRERGFKSEKTIEYLQIGFEPDYIVWYMQGEEYKSYHSPAHTIPIWVAGDKVNDVKMRVLNPSDLGRDRYRSLGKTMQSSLYMPAHDLSVEKKAVIVEGEFKAGVMWEALDTTDVTVFGVQSKKPDPSVFKDLKDCEVVYIALDPDAFMVTDKSGISAVQYCTDVLGKNRVQIVEFPCKPDDGIAKYGMNPWNYIRMSRKP